MPICCGDDPIKVNASIGEIAETMYHYFCSFYRGQFGHPKQQFDWQIVSPIVCGKLCIYKIRTILFLFKPLSDGYNFVTIKKIL